MDGSPEAWELFLEQYPESREAEAVRQRVDEVRYQRAKRQDKSEAFRDYLTRHPEGKHVKSATKQEDLLAWNEAEQGGTAEAYTGYIDGHPEGSYLKKAQTARAQVLYLPQVSVGELSIEKTNMADDPEGPLNGWQVSADVLNSGPDTLEVVQLAVDYLGAGGLPIKSDRWWAVSPNLSGFPVPPYMKAPLGPGQTREFLFSTAESPEGWEVGRFGLRVTRIRLKD